MNQICCKSYKLCVLKSQWTLISKVQFQVINLELCQFCNFLHEIVVKYWVNARSNFSSSTDGWKNRPPLKMLQLYLFRWWVYEFDRIHDFRLDEARFIKVVYLTCIFQQNTISSLKNMNEFEYQRSDCDWECWNGIRIYVVPCRYLKVFEITIE